MRRRQWRRVGIPKKRALVRHGNRQRRSRGDKYQLGKEVQQLSVLALHQSRQVHGMDPGCDIGSGESRPSSALPIHGLINWDIS